MSPNPDPLRLFFALWPDDPLREQIRERCQAAVSRCGGRLVPLSNLHITLLFIGDVALPGLAQALSVGAAITMPAFELSLDCVETPGGARVAWLAASRSVGSVEALAHQLRLSNLSAEHAAPYRAHVTLARDPTQRLPPASIEPVSWLACDFVLVRSQMRRRGAGPEYEVLARWPLRG